MIQINDKIKEALNAPMRYIKYKVEVYFDDATPTDITEDVMSIDTLDETSSSTLPFGEVTYNELSIELDNLQNKYTITNNASPYAGKLISGKKVVLTYLVETSDDVFESVPGGVYYTDDWVTSTDSNSASLVCYDKMSLVGYKPINRFRVQTDISIIEAFTMLFEAGGLSPHEYVISPNISGTLPYFWCSASDLRTCLGDLSTLTRTVVYVDRSNIINVMPLVSPFVTDIALTDSTLILSAKSEPSYSNVYSGVRIKYDVAIGSKLVNLYSNDELILKPGINIISNELFETSPVLSITGIRILSSVQCSVIDYDCTDGTFNMTIDNKSSVDVKVSLVIDGTVVQTVTNTYFLQQPSDVNNILEVTLPLASSQEYVQEYAKHILSLFTRYTSSVEVNLRGYPGVDIHDRLLLNSASTSINDTMQVVRVSNKFNSGMDTTIVVRYI